MKLKGDVLLCFIDSIMQESSGQGSSGYRVIVNEGARGPKAREHQASTVPFPFTGVSDFEASIRY